MYKLLDLLVLHLPHYLDIVALLPDGRQLLLEEAHAIQLLDVASVHVVELLYEMYKRLRLHKPLSELLLVLRFGVLFKIKDMMRRRLVVGRSDVIGFLQIVLLLAISGFLLVEIFKIVNQIE